MIDKEKVIQGLESCVKGKRYKCTSIECPYSQKGPVCYDELRSDAIFLLTRTPVCKNCGTLLAEIDKYCRVCGRRVNDDD